MRRQEKQILTVVQHQLEERGRLSVQSQQTYVKSETHTTMRWAASLQECTQVYSVCSP